MSYADLRASLARSLARAAKTPSTWPTLDPPLASSTSTMDVSRRGIAAQLLFLLLTLPLAPAVIGLAGTVTSLMGVYSQWQAVNGTGAKK